jgi:hypothetical protein
MSQRINEKDLLIQIHALNDALGYPTESYSKGDDGKYHPNANVFCLDAAYGGYQLAQMSNKEGCTGQSNPLSTGFVSKRELHAALCAFKTGIYTMQRLAA